jgi:hypothetical protein
VGTTPSSRPHEAAARSGALGPEAVFREARRALREGSLEEAREGIDALTRAFDVHFALEERVYFPALAVLRPKLAESLRAFGEEHERMRTRLGELARGVGQSEREGLLEALEDLVAIFLRHEEREEELLVVLEGDTGR